MTDAANIQASAGTAQNTPAASTTVAPSATSSAASGSSISSILAKPITAAQVTGISPRIEVDPVAGAIIQYLNSSGQVQTQIPSVAVVAYLRAGLTAQGFAPPLPASHHTSSSGTGKVA